MYIRNPQPQTLALMNRLYRMKLEGKTYIEIERESGLHYTNVSAYVNYLRKNPQLIEKLGGEK